ncbi:MAG: transposase [Planctomycetota bacterium]
MSGPRRRLKRIESPCHARFLTFSCYQRLPLFQNTAIRDAFVERLATNHQHLSFDLFAWVVMPDHVHLLLRPPADATVSRLLNALKAGHAKQVLDRWQRLNVSGPHLPRLNSG